MAYRQDTNKKNLKKVDSLLHELPDFCTDLFDGRALRLESYSQLAYANDLKKFFFFAIEHLDEFNNIKIPEITLEHLAQIDYKDISAYIKFCQNNGNAKSSIERRLSSISMMYEYFLKKDMLPNNPIRGVDRTKTEKNKIIRLDGPEKASFLKSAQYGTGLSKQAQKWHDKNGIRDFAIMQIFLTTGIRISELVGLNITDVNIDENRLSILRKGNKYGEVFFSDKAKKALQEYLAVRYIYRPLISEKALFLSSRGGRLGVRAVQLMVKKYAVAALPGKSDVITPHKLRATFATDFYRGTGDIYATSSAMGHEHIQTTTIYADGREDLAEMRNVVDEI